MTSSETPTDSPPPARGVRGRRPAIPAWALAAAVVPPGWFFILRIARWHVTSSTVMLLICWAAVVATGFWGIRMALAAAAEGDEGWFSVRGRRDELEREKRSLLKAIKEIEFDHATGKLSKDDAAALTASYRARAIEVLKTIEAEDGTAAATGSVREQILAEVRARAALDGKVKAGKGKKASAKAKDVKPEGKAESKAESKADAKPEAKADAKTDDAPEAAVEAAAVEAAVVGTEAAPAAETEHAS